LIPNIFVPLVIAVFCSLPKHESSFTRWLSQEVAVELEALHDEQPQLLRENVELHRRDSDEKSLSFVVGMNFSWKHVLFHVLFDMCFRGGFIEKGEQ